MKVLGLLSLALVGICLAAPAPTDGYATNAVQSLKTTINANNTVTALSVPSTQHETPDRATPDNLYRISISFSEYCDAGVLKARGWLSNAQVRFELYLNPKQVTKLALHPGYDLVLGPYSFDAHAFAIEYDGCRWSSEGGYPCGWCEAQPWSLGPLDCRTGLPGVQRLTYRTCYFVDNRISKHLSIRDKENSTSLSTSTTTTSPTHPDTPIAAQASTLVLMPAIIQTVLPSPLLQSSTILPFHLRIWESCSPSASAIYTNGNMAQSLALPPGLVTSIQHRVPGYANLEVGPYDYARSRVRFRYVRSASEGGECVWFDDETWRSCGECRAGLWSAAPVDCGRGGGARWKDMDCSVLLGVREGV